MQQHINTNTDTRCDVWMLLTCTEIGTIGIHDHSNLTEYRRNRRHSSAVRVTPEFLTTGNVQNVALWIEYAVYVCMDWMHGLNQWQNGQSDIRKLMADFCFLMAFSNFYVAFYRFTTKSVHSCWRSGQCCIILSIKQLSVNARSSLQ